MSPERHRKAHHKRQIEHAERKISNSLEKRISTANLQKEAEPTLPEEAFLDGDLIHVILLYTHGIILKNQNNHIKTDYDFVDSHVDTPTNPKTYLNKTKYLFKQLSLLMKRQLASHYIPKALIKHVA